MAIIPISVLHEEMPSYKNWYTSDWHLFHEKMAYLRDFNGDVEALIESMVDKINALVAPDDWLYHLGDFAMFNSQIKIKVLKILKERIKCKNIYAIQGNHDPSKVLDYLQQNRGIIAWRQHKFIYDYAFGKKVAVAMFHHPVIDYHSEMYASLCLHGHSHGTLKHTPFDLFDVGWDVWGQPVTLEMILQKYYPVVGNQTSLDEYYSQYKRRVESGEILDTDRYK